VIGRLELVAAAERLAGVSRRYSDGALPIGSRGQGAQNIARCHLGVRTFVPDDVERFEALLGRHIWSPTTATRSSSATICRTPETPRALPSSIWATLPPKTGQAIKVATFTPRRHRVDAVDGFAVHFIGGVEPFQRTSDQLEILRRFQRRILRSDALRRRFDKIGIGRTAPARVVEDDAVGGAAGGGVDIPHLRRRLDEQRTGAGAGAAHGHLEGADRCRAAGRLEPDERIGEQLVVWRSRLDAHLRKVRVKLLRDDGGQ
jgi:hypothetical protein